MLQPGDPATLYGFAQVLVVHVAHGHLAIRLVLGPQRRPQIGRGAGGSAGRRVAALVALELAEQITGPGLLALVIDQVVHLQRIVAALQGETLDVVDAIGAVVQVDDQRILPFGQLILGLLAAVLRTAAGLVRAVADQAALRLIGTLAAALEQLERHIGAILTARILRQMQFDDVATTRIDGQVEHVGTDADQLAARCAGRQGAGLLLTGNRRNVVGIALGRCARAVRQRRSGWLALRGFGRQGCLTVVLIPLKNHQVGNDC